MCASNSPPGTLNALSVPQFIVLTNDDAVTAATQALILNVTERHSNPNACKIPATWFVTAEGSNATLLSKLYARGHSISTNGAKLKANPTVDEIIAGKLWLNQSAGIPMEDVTGFRAPFQLFTPAQRAALSANGFRYDSSITELVGTTTSPAKDQLLWPYTMDYGIPQSCSVAGGVCTTSERYAGLWEFPMWTTYDESGNNAGAMDPAVTDWLSIYQRELYYRLNGNRAPLGVYIHASWLAADSDHADQLNQFFEWALSQPDVWVVTIDQVLDWMQNPVPASEYVADCPSVTSRLARLPASAQLCMSPNKGCGGGTWSTSLCSCQCTNAGDDSVDGYCLDVDGSCSVRRTLDIVSGTYTCPPLALAPAAAPVAAPAPSPAAAPALAAQQIRAAAAAEALRLSTGLSFSAGLCGHDLLEYSGLTASGFNLSSDGYAAASKVVDGSCMTCAIAEAVGFGGDASFSIRMPTVSGVSGVRLVADLASTVAVSVVDTTTGVSTICGASVSLPASSKTAVIADCPVGTVGNVVVVQANADTLSLCDIYPLATATDLAAPAPAPASASSQGQLAVAFRVGGGILEVTGSTAPLLCAYLVSLSTDSAASCSVAKIAAVSTSTNARRLLASTGIVDVALILDAEDADAIAVALKRGTDVAGQLYAQDISIVPTVQTAMLAAPGSADASADDLAPAPGPALEDLVPAPAPEEATVAAPAPAPATSDELLTAAGEGSGKASNVGVIAGAAAGGAVGGLAAIGGLIWWVLRRRRARAAESGEVAAAPPPPPAGRGPISPPRAGVVATVVISGDAKKGGDAKGSVKGVLPEESTEGTLKTVHTWIAAPPAPSSEPSQAESQNSRGTSRGRGPIRPPRHQPTWR